MHSPLSLRPRPTIGPSPKHWVEYATAIAACFAALGAMAAAIAAAWQAHITDRISEVQLRAYVTAEAEEIEPTRNNSDDLFVLLHITNSGQTPAYKIKSSFISSYEPLQKSEIYERAEAEKIILSLGNNQKFVYKVYLNMKYADYHNMARLNKQLYVYGVVWYNDIYEKSHPLDFCYRLMDDSGVGHFIPCDHFSLAD